MALTSVDSFSFQPWARKTTDEGSLKDVLARVNLERGHFRDITEASLQEEIAAEGGLELSESEEEDEQQEDGEDRQKARGKPSTREELYKVKYEMLANVRAAEQEILMSLDFVSLLLSKDALKQAQTTISPVLKDSVPFGSLGTDLWQRMPVDKAREAQDDLLATNVRMEGLQQSANDLLAAANRLQDNVRKETEYWNQILSISDKDWNVCRIPGQQNRLGVRFGFSESSPEFSRRGMAALNAGSDGTIMLERGIGSKPKALRAVLRKDGKAVGISRLPNDFDNEEMTLEARIRYARDSLYDEELYHEMIRESRTLASLGVGMNRSSIYYESRVQSNAAVQLSLDLMSLDEDHSLISETSDNEDALAQAVVLAARLLLGQAHRERLKKRSELPAPLSDKQKDEKPILPILRPIISFVLHRSALDRLNSYMNVVARVLESANLQISQQPARFNLPDLTDSTNINTFIKTLMQPWVSEAALHISAPDTGDLKFRFNIETTLANSFANVFTLNVPSRTDGYRFDNVDELVTAADTKVASGLAKAIEGALGEDWVCNDNEALLIEDVGPYEKSKSLWVSFDSADGVLSLNSLVNKMTWSLHGERSEIGFWDALGQILESQD